MALTSDETESILADIAQHARAHLERIAALEAAPDPSPEGLARWLDLAIETVATLAEECEDEAIDPILDEISTRIAGNAGLAIAARTRLVEALTAWDTERALQQMRLALELPLRDEERLEWLISLASKLRAGMIRVWSAVPEVPTVEELNEERAHVADQILALLAAPSGIGVDQRVRAHGELAYGDTAMRLRHTAIAAELADGCSDVELRCDTIERYADQLFDAGELDRAEALVLALPQQPVALLEDIARRRGTLAEPPAEAFEDPPQVSEETAELSAFIGPPALPEGFVAYFTPAELVDLIRGQHLVSPEKVREWSHGQVRTPDDLESEKIFGPRRSYACQCGRFLGNQYQYVVCHKCGVWVVSSAYRAFRPAHIVLAQPVVHPWYVAVIAHVLGISQVAVRAAAPGDLRDRLCAVELADLGERLRLGLEDRSESRQAEMTARLAIVEALLDTHARPEWCVLELLPVWPPMAELPNHAEQAALRRIYVEILENPGVPQPVHSSIALFG